MQEFWLYAPFTLFVLAILALDLGVFHRRAHAVTLRQAGTWTGAWVALALLFNGWVYAAHGPEKALEFLTGYLVEYSLSVDNIFVFVTVFAFFAVPAAFQHRVLFWGILGALAMRGAMIAAGSALLARFHWALYLLGAFLVLTGLKMLFRRDAHAAPERNLLVRAFRWLLPVTEGYDGPRFFVRRRGSLHATPLLLVLLAVETTDLVFAADSIPAIFAITRDPFIVYTSNVFAVLGLRSLYFLLAGIVERFRCLRAGLALVLRFVGARMLLAGAVEIPVAVSLAGVLAILGSAILGSLVVPGRRDAVPAPAEPPRGPAAFRK
jgi:tellurite resistance protein TerC